MKQLIYTLIGRIDSIIVKHLDWKHLPHSSNKFMYLHPHIYKGRTITLKDETIISKGDWVAELHIDNTNIKSLNTSYSNLIRLLKSELISLRESFEDEPYSKLKAVYGITVFHEIAARQGFTIIEINNKFKKFFGSLWENILRQVLGRKKSKGKERIIVSKECWISKNQIMNI